MITRDTLLPYLARIEPDFEAACNEEREFYGYFAPPYNPSLDMQALYYLILERLTQGRSHDLKHLFNSIELLLVNQNAEPDVQDAIYTSLLENLLAECSQGSFAAESFTPLLGQKSREFCQFWNQSRELNIFGL